LNALLVFVIDKLLVLTFATIISPVIVVVLNDDVVPIYIMLDIETTPSISNTILLLGVFLNPTLLPNMYIALVQLGVLFDDVLPIIILFAVFSS
jgi:hypothetical protein